MPPLRTGLLSFGLVSIPVQLYGATKDQRIAFNLLHAKCGSRVQNRYYCPVCNLTVERDDRVRGYEFAKDQYVQFTDAELESLETESSNNIELKEFIPLSKIDPVYFENAYCFRRWRRRRETLSADGPTNFGRSLGLARRATDRWHAPPLRGCPAW